MPAVYLRTTSSRRTLLTQPWSMKSQLYTWLTLDLIMTSHWSTTHSMITAAATQVTATDSATPDALTAATLLTYLKPAQSTQNTMRNNTTNYKYLQQPFYLRIRWKIPWPNPMRTNLDHFDVFHSRDDIVMMGDHAACLTWQFLFRHFLRVLWSITSCQTKNSY